VHRLASTSLAAAATAAFVLLAIDAGTPWWAASLLWLAPDLTLLGGLDRGRLSPRAVPAYNAVHSLWAPAIAAAAAALGLLPWVIAAAWLSHITVDRALGFGLRTRDGFQRA
jgi:Domain of unknown function (DUF4260)